jgi:hypothetical protein
VLLGRVKSILKIYSDFDGFDKGWINKENIRKVFLFSPQCSYICLKHKEPAVDFIGYFENLKEDYNYVKKPIGVESELLQLNRVRP